jgi:uncharacterized integral membrane protein
MPDEHVEREWESVNDKSRAGLIVVAIIAVVFLIFVFSNTGSVDIQFLSLTLNMPEWLMFTVLFVLGVLVGWTVSSLRRRAKMKAVKNSKK